MIVVTGSTGNVGSALLEALRKKDVEVAALVHSEAKAPAVEELGAEPRPGDFAEPETLVAAFASAQKVFLVSPSSLEQVQWEHNVVEAARSAGVEHVVKLSIINASPESDLTIYSSHGHCEARLRTSELRWTVLRCNEFMQNFLLSAATIADEGTVYGTGVGEAGVGMVDVRDIASVAAEVLTGEGHDGAIYEVTGPDASTFAEAARQLSSGLGQEISYAEVPRGDYVQALVDDGTPQWYAEALADLYESYGRGMADRVAPTVREFTGTEPRSVEAFARDHADELLGR